MIRNLLAATGIAAAISLGVGGQAGADDGLKDLYAFGDSLTDTGNLFFLSGGAAPPSPPYYQGRFSNGPVWIESFDDLVGLDAGSGSPFERNFAIGGAFTDANGVAGPGTGILGPLQTGALPAGSGFFDGDDLVAVWAGANDYLLGGFTDPAAQVANIETALRALHDAGARHFLVPNLPDLGETPFGQFVGADVLNALTAGHNAALASAMSDLRQELGIEIIAVDINWAFTEILAHPASFGFDNVTVPCLSATAPCGAGFEDADSTLFWDDVHPTAAGHALIAEFAAATFRTATDGVRTVTAQADVAALVTQAQFRAAVARQHAVRTGFAGAALLGNQFRDTGLLEHELYGGGNAATGGDPWLGIIETSLPGPDVQPGLSFFLYGNDESGDRLASDGRIGFGYDTSVLSAGIDYRVDETLLIGVLFGTGAGTADLDGGAGDVLVDSSAMTLYGSLTTDGWYADASAGVSFDDYGQITRSTGTVLFPTARATTEGTTLHASMEGGYMFDRRSWSIGPFAGLAFSRSEIDGYAESGAGPLNLTVADQRDDSLIGTLGFRGRARIDSPHGPIFSRLNLSLEHEFRADDHLVVSRLSGAGDNAIYADASGVDVIKLDAGLAMRLSDAAAGFLDYDAEMDLGSTAEHLLMLRVRFDF